jgi:hypothetical protein
LRDFPHRQHDSKKVYHVQEATTVNDVARSVPRIYAVVENQQERPPSFVVELEGIISKKPVSILIDLDLTLVISHHKLLKHVLTEEETCKSMVSSISHRN